MIKLLPLEENVRLELTTKISQDIGKKVNVLGYSNHEGRNPTETIQEIKRAIELEQEHPVELYEVNPHDTLPLNLRRTMVQFRDQAPSVYYVIYQI